MLSKFIVKLSPICNTASQPALATYKKASIDDAVETILEMFSEDSNPGELLHLVQYNISENRSPVKFKYPLYPGWQGFSLG